MNQLRDLVLGGDDFWDEVIADSQARKSNPLPFAADVLERLFLHESDKEFGFARWEEAMSQGIWWADDALTCLTAVSQTPPSDFGAWVREHAGTVWDGDRPASPAAHVAWLDAVIERLRGAFDDYLVKAKAPGRA